MNDYFYVIYQTYTSIHDDSYATNILGVTTDLEEAKEKFRIYRAQEHTYATSNGYRIYTDDDCCFDAGREGEYITENTRVKIEKIRRQE